MSQNHYVADGILGRNQIDDMVLNVVGLYHGISPWYYFFGAKTSYVTWIIFFHMYTQLILYKPAYKVFNILKNILLDVTHFF